MTKEKEEYIKAVLECRAEIVERIIKSNPPDAMYFKGKLEGYRQAIELLGESEDSIKIEIG